MCFKPMLQLSQRNRCKTIINKVLKEVKQIETLSHPNLANYIESYENERSIYIVMEYYQGKQLFDMITEKVDKNGTFSEVEVI